MNTRPRPEFRINLWRTSLRPKFYAYQIYRDRDYALLAGGECRTKISAQREAQARIRQLSGLVLSGAEARLASGVER
jgi:hypothetical protein